MGIEDISQDPVTVTLDKPREMRYVNRGFRSLCRAYGTMREAIAALQAITPRRDADGNMVNIEQDESFYSTIIEWLYSGLVGADKAIGKGEVSDLVDELSIIDLVTLRVSIWEAFARSLPKREEKEADPTTTA